MSREEQIRRQVLGRPTTGRPIAGNAPIPTHGREVAQDAAAILMRGVDAARSALPMNQVISHDGETTMKIPGASSMAGGIDALSTGTPITQLVSEDGRGVRTPVAVSAGQTLTIRAGLTQTSRTLAAGAGLVEIPDGKSVGNTKTGPVAMRPSVSYSTVEPAPFDLVDVDLEAEVTETAAPILTAELDRDTMSARAFRFLVPRAQRRDVPPKLLGGMLVLSAVQGIGKAIDAELLAAVSATSPSAFSVAAAAAAGIDMGDLRAIIGTGAAPTSMEIDQGQLYAGGVPAVLSSDTSAHLIAAWNRFAIAIEPEILLQFTRLNLKGDVEVTCWVHLQALIPDSSFCWTAA